jgi:hypothetical protein
MDIATLVALAMGFLTAMATKAGEDVYEKTKGVTTRVYEAIRARFAREHDGERSSALLQTFIDGDVTVAGDVEHTLGQMLAADPAFARELVHLLQPVHQSLRAAEEAKASHVRLNNTLGRGQQEIILEARASIDDVQMNLGQERPTP